MTNPTHSKRSVPDAATAVPTQRIVTDELAARRSEVGPDAAAPAHSVVPADLDAALDESLDRDRRPTAAGLPDLSAVLATVPGGLGAELGESFTYAGQRWTAADARVSGTPIGLQLAIEQRGLEVPAGEVEVPLQRARP